MDDGSDLAYYRNDPDGPDFDEDKYVEGYFHDRHNLEVQDMAKALYNYFVFAGYGKYLTGNVDRLKDSLEKVIDEKQEKRTMVLNSVVKKILEGADIRKVLESQVREGIERLVIQNGKIKYSDRENLYRDLAGTIQYLAYENPLIKLGQKDGVEYGIVGKKLTGPVAYRVNSGFIGYKIDGDVVYITKFSPTSKVQASKWVREDIKNNNDDVWIVLGKL